MEREWAKVAAASGAGQAHTWTKIPLGWRAATAKAASNPMHDVIPEALVADLKTKFVNIWEPAAVPLPNPCRIPFPSWLPCPCGYQGNGNHADKKTTNTLMSEAKVPSQQVSTYIGTDTISGKDVDIASSSFRHSTSQTYDGLHVSHWKHLEDKGKKHHC